MWNKCKDTKKYRTASCWCTSIRASLIKIKKTLRSHLRSHDHWPIPFPIQQEKSRFSGPTPSNGPFNWCCPHQNHYVPRHKNNQLVHTLIVIMFCSAQYIDLLTSVSDNACEKMVSFEYNGFLLILLMAKVCKDRNIKKINSFVVFVWRRGRALLLPNHGPNIYKYTKP